MGCKCINNENKSEIYNKSLCNEPIKSSNKKSTVSENNALIKKELFSSNISPSKNTDKNQYYIESDTTNKDAAYPKYIDTSTKINKYVIYNSLLFTSNKEDSFKLKLLREINSARNNPQSFITKVQNLKNNIINKNNMYFLKVNSSTNIRLLRGKKAFENCINFLKEQKPLDELFIKDDLSFDIPFDNPYNYTDQIQVSKILSERNKIINKKYMEIINFHYDITIPNPELSALLQIIDDTNIGYQRRLNIFNEKASYVGISIEKKNDGIICFYLVFAKDTEF